MEMPGRPMPRGQPGPIPGADGREAAGGARGPQAMPAPAATPSSASKPTLSEPTRVRSVFPESWLWSDFRAGYMSMIFNVKTNPVGLWKE